MKTKKVLIIDDSDMQIELLKFLMEKIDKPVSVQYEKCGVQGLEYLESITLDEFPDIIISDINLTMMSGVEFFEILSDMHPNSWDKTSFFVASSIAPREVHRKRFPEAHIQGFLEKPLMDTTLMSLV